MSFVWLCFAIFTTYYFRVELLKNFIRIVSDFLNKPENAKGRSLYFNQPLCFPTVVIYKNRSLAVVSILKE